VSLSQSIKTPAVPDEELLRWMVAEIERLGKKLDNATGFAENTKTTLAARVATGGRRFALAIQKHFDVRCRVVSAAGYGMYNGYTIVNPPSTINSASALTVGAFGSDDEEVLVINLDETDQSTNDLVATALPRNGVFIVGLTDDQGRRVVAISERDVAPCPEES
jgi:hypothetical protein